MSNQSRSQAINSMAQKPVSQFSAEPVTSAEVLNRKLSRAPRRTTAIGSALGLGSRQVVLPRWPQLTQQWLCWWRSGKAPPRDRAEQCPERDNGLRTALKREIVSPHYATPGARSFLFCSQGFPAITFGNCSKNPMKCCDVGLLFSS